MKKTTKIIIGIVIIPIIIVMLFFGSAVVVGIYEGLTSSDVVENVIEETEEVEENYQESQAQEETLTIDKQYEIAYELIDNYMNDKEVNYMIEESRDTNLIVVKLPVNDINFRLAVVQQEGYAKEMLDYISTHSKNCMELITENACNDLGVEFAIVPEDNTDNAFLATINGVTIINVIKDYTDIQ
mgnify:FL=1